VTHGAAARLPVAGVRGLPVCGRIGGSGALLDEFVAGLVDITVVGESGVSAGTGIVVSSGGLVLTNAHVIAGPAVCGLPISVMGVPTG